MYQNMSKTIRLEVLNQQEGTAIESRIGRNGHGETRDEPGHTCGLELSRGDCHRDG